MFYAYDKNDIKVHISKVEDDKQYFCKKCNQLLKIIPEHQRCGQKINKHFSHIGNPNSQNKDYIPCPDHWHYCMSEWHCKWQERFPIECRECLITNGIEKHIADVLINNTVVEFQHSKISIEEFRERNEFYTSCGYDVVWIFDLSTPTPSGNLFNDGIIQEDCDDDSKFYWRAVPKFYRQLCINEEKAIVVFQFFDIPNDDEGILARISNGYKEMSEFYTKDWYSVREFIEEITNDSFAPDIIKQKQLKNIKDGHTILELWENNCCSIIVKNLITGKEMLISGKNGVINSEGDKIIGKYSNKSSSGKYVYSPDYPVKYHDLPIWKLKYKKSYTINKIQS